MKKESSLTLKIVSKKNTVFQGAVSLVKVQASHGEIGFLAEHESFVSTLTPGPIICRHAHQKTTVFYCSGGFVECHNNEVLVLAQHAVDALELDENKVFEKKTELEEKITVCKDSSLQSLLTQDLKKVMAQIRSCHELKRAQTALLQEI